MEAKYHRVLIKMSGEALAGSMNKGIDFAFVEIDLGNHRVVGES